ncbi:hypothetical protein AB0395_34015 [Streptosporangium sp. NPDC051023]|uniref:hypothetical protein n=1 Tax=Streptosporangium sp. NPDC051023 TaxID=3155410 RepID=UPI00344C5608
MRVSGSFAIDNAFDKPTPFTEVFTLKPISGQESGIYIHDQIFRTATASPCPLGCHRNTAETGRAGTLAGQNLCTVRFLE